MLVQKSRALIRKLPDLILPGGDHRTWLTDAVASPLERDRASPKGWKNRDTGGVGLGIVAALESAAAAAPSFHLSAPMAITSPRAATSSTARCAYTAAGVCCGGDYGAKGGQELGRKAVQFFCGSPQSVADDGEAPAFPVADFLSHCHLCRKRLHGKDIYMYRGEKAFCSMECRYRQIVSDDQYQEKCWSEAAATSSSDVSSSPYSAGKLVFTGIAAA